MELPRSISTLPDTDPDPTGSGSETLDTRSCLFKAWYAEGGGGDFKWLSYLYLEVKYQGSLGEQDNCPSSLYAPPRLS